MSMIVATYKKSLRPIFASLFRFGVFNVIFNVNDIFLGHHEFFLQFSSPFLRFVDFSFSKQARSCLLYPREIIPFNVIRMLVVAVGFAKGLQLKRLH